MKLLKTEIEGYRSIRHRMHLIVEHSVTVILGPNDHGKTNLLNALLHLNEDSPFESDDLNWDCDQESDVLPSVVATMTLTDDERQWLLTNENKKREAINQLIAERELVDDEVEDDDEDEEHVEAEIRPPANVATPPIAGTVTDTSAILDVYDEEDDEEEYELPEAPLRPVTLKEIPREISIRRVGVRGELRVVGLEDCQEEVHIGFAKFYPRFELIDPITKLNDNVTSEELEAGKNEFMRGIFYYAGLDPDDSKDLFPQSDRSQMAITRASETLNETLKQSWSQGKDLSFRLTHNSKEERIDLQIQDPSVQSTYVRASRRSSGFTHYFSLKTILHSRQKDHPSESYILMFDEPGVFLHPSGQYDLLQVIETLAIESQVLYVTHSLFMINKTYPTRHRLIMKADSGTTLDGKPYVGRWQAVLGALGLTLTGSILFANHVVLTEGDSDPIYIYAMIQKAVLAGKSKLDINALAVMSTAESKHTEVLVRLLSETVPRPKIAVLTDGDKGGKERLKYLHDLLKQCEIPEKALSNETSIEDHIPMIREVYVPSVAAYVGKLTVIAGNAKPDKVEFENKFLQDFDTKFEKGKVTHSVAQWAANAAKSIGGISGSPSKVGIAREYASRLLEFSDDQFKFDARAKALVDWIHKEAGVPEQHPVERKILED